MMLKGSHLMIFIILGLCFSCNPSVNNDVIKSYYTKISKGEDWEKHSRTTEHPDIIVDLKDGQLVFWRGTSYLPYWETTKGSWSVKEIIPRKGDGPENRPDNVNMFSNVKIISSSTEEVVIQWRYLPTFESGNPKGEVDHLKFTDEYFAIKGDGSVERKIMSGTPKHDDWENGTNVITETFKLGLNGISESEVNESDIKATVEQVKPNATKSSDVTKPVLHFNFDEAKGDVTTEAVSGEALDIIGHKSYWKSGTSGTSLAFDGYNTGIVLPKDKAPELKTFTIDAWISIGAYPWKWAPVIHQSEWEKSGFYFGVYADGKIGLKIKTKKWNEITTDYELPLMHWVNISAVYDGKNVVIYVNGEEKASSKVSGDLDVSANDMIVGMNNLNLVPADPVRPDCEECHTPCLFGMDALMDEIRIYDKALTAEQVKKIHDDLYPGQKIVENPDMDKRVFPMGHDIDAFEANYTHLKYYDTWDYLSRFGEHCDIVVDFKDNPSKFIFWRGVNYVPQMVNGDNQWYTNEFNESWDPGGSWGEPMSDKQSMISHVRLIENTPARKVIHWRFAQVQINGTQQNYDAETDWGDFSDWYYYIYPDGIASKRMLHWSSDDPITHEFQESIGLMMPGQIPGDVHDDNNTVIIADMNDQGTYNWLNGPPNELEEDWDKTVNIQLINYKSEYKPFTGGGFDGAWVYNDSDNKTAPYANIVVYTHWPLGQLPTDGVRALKPDRASSNGYTHLFFDEEKNNYYNRGGNWAERVMIEGMTNKSINELRVVTKSFLNAAEIQDLKGAKTTQYDQRQRAYILTGEDSDISFQLNGSEENPIWNPCFVIKNWNSKKIANLKINDKQIPQGEDFRTGIITDTDGTETLIVYVRYSATSKISVKLY